MAVSLDDQKDGWLDALLVVAMDEWLDAKLAARLVFLLVVTLVGGMDVTLAVSLDDQKDGWLELKVVSILFIK